MTPVVTRGCTFDNSEFDFSVSNTLPDGVTTVQINEYNSNYWIFMHGGSGIDGKATVVTYAGVDGRHRVSITMTPKTDNIYGFVPTPFSFTFDVDFVSPDPCAVAPKTPVSFSQTSYTY